MCNFTINPTPSDATVIIKNALGTVLASGTGSRTVKVQEGTSIIWNVSKTGCETNSNESNPLIINSDTIKDIILNATFTIESEPNSATINIMDTSGKILTSGTGKVSVKLPVGTNVKWSVSKIGYISQEGNSTIGDPILIVKLKDKTVKFEIIPRIEGVVATDATVMMNEEERSYVRVREGTLISYNVSKKGYVTQEGQVPATEEPLYIDLEPKVLRYTITPNPSNAKVIITKNGQAYENKTITCKIGDVINYTVSADWYVTKTRSSDLTIEDQDVAETVELELLEDMLRIPPYNYRAVNITKDADDGMDNDFGGSLDYAEAKGVKKGNTATYTWYFSQSEAKTQAEKMQNIISQGTGRDYRIVARCLMGVSASSSYNITWSIGRYYCGFLVWICKSIKSAI